MSNGNQTDRGANANTSDISDSGLLSTRNLIVAAIVAALGGSGASVVQSTKSLDAVADRYTGTHARRDQDNHRHEHDTERQLVLAEYASLSRRISELEEKISTHQDGHQGKVKEVVTRLTGRVDKLGDDLRALEREVDRKLVK